MKMFLQMCETAREKKILDNTQVASDQEFMDSVNSNALERKKYFEDCLKTCEVFVLHDGIDKENLEQDNSDEMILAPPFECFSVELTNKGIFKMMDHGVSMSAISVMAKEVSPGYFDYFVYMTPTDKWWPIISLVRSTDKDARAMQMKSVINQYIGLMHRAEQGVEKVSETIRIGSGKQKKKSQLRRVIHIKPKSRKGDENKDSWNRHVEWSHSWLVRGHWRKLASEDALGKDRAGNYCIKGKTYVEPFKKGEGKLEKKVRIFK